MRFSFYLAAEATTPGQLDMHLANFLHKLYGMGQRVLVRCPDEARAQRLSDLLWKTPRSAFLPHSTSSEELPPPEQPVYLTSAAGNPNNASMLVRLSGSDENTQDFTEVVEFFSGLEAEKAAARQRWKRATEKECPRRFFIQEKGRWLLKQEAS